MTSARRTLCACLLVALAPALAGGSDPDIRERVAQAYPRILALWAEGQAERALADLEALETPLLRPAKADRDVEELWRAKLGVIRDTIEQSSIDVIVPIMLLHHDAYRHYVRKRASRLARHSLVMSAELAEFYAERSEGELADRHAGDLLTSLAGHLQSGQVLRRSAQIFDRALALDPSNAAAHMGLGALHERHDELSKAAEHYGAAARLEPSSAEARLRLGICAVRQGDLRLAERQFDAALELGEPGWVVRFAYQEKARLQEELSEGAGVAREGRRRFPESSRQAIQLAFLLEQQHQSSSALEVLGEITGEPEPESERYRYARWPHELLDGVRARLRETAKEQSGVLASATSGSSPVKPGA
jgi:tetratricopeptide (TPR) repeat protein